MPGGIANTAFQKLCKDAVRWKHLEHPNVQPFLGLDSSSSKEVPTPGLVSSWAKRGNLIDLVSSSPKDLGDRDILRLVRISVTRSEARSLTGKQLQEVALGLAYLHSEGVVHGNLRCVSIAFGHADRRAEVSMTADKRINQRERSCCSFGLRHCKLLEGDLALRVMLRRNTLDGTGTPRRWVSQPDT